MAFAAGVLQQATETGGPLRGILKKPKAPEAQKAVAVNKDGDDKVDGAPQQSDGESSSSPDEDYRSRFF